MTISSVENQSFSNCSLYETNVYHVVFPETIFLSWDLIEQPMPSKSSIKRHFINELMNDHRVASRKNINLPADLFAEDIFYVSSLQESYKDAIIKLIAQRKIEFVRTDFPLLFMSFYLPKYSIFELKKPLRFQEYGAEIDRVFLIPNRDEASERAIGGLVFALGNSRWRSAYEKDSLFTLLPFRYFKPFEVFIINNFLDIEIVFHPKGIHIPNGYLKKYLNQPDWLEKGPLRNDY